MKVQWIPLVLALLTGLGIGWLVPRPHRAVESQEVASPDTQRALQFGPRSAGNDRQWKSRAAIELAGEDQLVMVPTGLLQGISKLSPVVSCRDDLFRRDDETLALLRITEREQRQLEQAWALRRAEVESLEVSNSSYSDLEDGSISIKIPDLSDVLGAVGNQFSDEVRSALGPERGDLLLNLKQVERAFAPESGERNYLVRVESVGDGKWRFHLTYRDNENHRVWVGDSVPREIRHITDAARVAPDISSLNEAE